METLNQRGQQHGRLDGLTAHPERCITITLNRHRRYPGWLDVTNFQPDLHPSDSGCVNPGGQFRLVHLPEQGGRRADVVDQPIDSLRALLLGWGPVYRKTLPGTATVFGDKVSCSAICPN